MALKAIIFDHDGTLVDSEFIHYGIWQSLLQTFGVDFSEKEYLGSHIGLPTLQGAIHLIEHYGLAISPEALYDQNIALTMQTLRSSPAPLMPGVEECIQWCIANSVRIAIATGASREELTCSFEGHDILRHCEVSTCRDDVNNNKPAPDVYQLAMNKLNLSPLECVAFEDSHNGVKSAIAAGLRCIAIPDQYSKTQDFSAATFIATDIREATAYMRKL